MQRRIAPVEEPVLLDHLRPLLLQMQQGLSRGLDEVVGVDGGRPGTMWM
jgi:hypothetical protein